jgi:hypothetical protein
MSTTHASRRSSCTTEPTVLWEPHMEVYPQEPEMVTRRPPQAPHHWMVAPE